MKTPNRIIVNRGQQFSQVDEAIVPTCGIWKTIAPLIKAGKVALVVDTETTLAYTARP